jgi:CD109 antigen
MRTWKVAAQLATAGLVLGIMTGILAGCQPATTTTTRVPISATTTEARANDPVDGYVALVPDTLRAGETASFSFTLWNDNKPADTAVTVAVMSKDKAVLVSTEGNIDGKGALALPVPRVPAGEYTVKVSGRGFSETTAVQIQPGTLLFLESDKPIYKPGQTVHVRLVALDSELKPATGQVTIEIQDAKAIKIFKKVVTTDQYGMATIDLPLSSEPNLGVWKLTATGDDGSSASQASTQLDVRVEEYVLPKYEVKAEMAKSWFLVNEPITGKVSAEYSFGRTVKGELKVDAYRYVGEWEKYATYSAQIDGSGDFRIEAAGYVAGVPEAGGEGNVRLDISVAETSTGYEQKTSELLTVAATPVNIQLIPESSAFKPDLPFGVVVVTETPGGEPVESQLKVEVSYTDKDFNQVDSEARDVKTSRGTALLTLTPPKRAVRMTLYAYTGDAAAGKEITAAYSPSGNFIHVQQQGDPALKVGDTARFRVLTTAEARTVYYEVVSRGRVVFTGSASGDISFKVTPAMAPQSKLLVYQLLQNGEVAADAIPFDVSGQYPQTVTASFSTQEAKPGEKVQVNVQTQGPAKVGLVAVDRSVFILAENRLNLEQVFAQIEALYMQPQAELHERERMGGTIKIPGAEDTFSDAGLIVLTDKDVPQGKELENPMRFEEALGAVDDAAPQAGGPMTTAAASATTTTGGQKSNLATNASLADVQRVRQFFPETWIWDETISDANGKATLDVEAPDSITTWDLRAVAVSPTQGLGISEAALKVFQPFFLQADLPYSSLRGEEFPVKIALYNYLDADQKIQVDLESAGWFDLVGGSSVTVTVAPNEVGSATFTIRPKTIGTQLLKVTARSSEAADAVNKSLIVEPEGVPRESVQNLVVPAGAAKALQLSLPNTGVVADSARAYVAVTGSLLAQTIDGLDQLLAMPFGCGEQNMILFAPDTFILKYLKGTNQLKPEIQAKAESLLITGYQRELTYRHTDGSFSAFGDQDPSGSLWLTAFVLKTFAQAKDLTFVDPDVLDKAAAWIESMQKSDGSFEQVGLVIHEDMMGGVKGKDTLTAFVAIALLEAGRTSAADKAIGYLEGRLGGISDPYTLALTTYALEKAKSAKAGQAMTKLVAAAIQDENGLHWSSAVHKNPEPYQQGGNGADLIEPGPDFIQPSLDIEATGYAALALIESQNRVDASRAAKWLVGQRNSQGGFGSTQDTVVALQALTEYATMSATDTAMTVTIRAGGTTKDITITPDNFDVTQVVEVPAGAQVELSGTGNGEAVVQGVLRYNITEAPKAANVFDIKVDYNTTQVAVNDKIDIRASVTFNPPQPMKAGMTVVDISVPTGFAAVDDSLAKMVEENKIKRYDVAGRKVILYIEDMSPGDTVNLAFQAVALYPVKAKSALSSAYSYYTPDWKGETLSAAMTVQ